jgi:thiaminase
MVTQQMMELLLARFNSIMKEHMQEITARMNANIAEMKADRNTYHQEMMARLGKTEADTEKTEPDPQMMQSTEEQQGSSRERLQ